VVRQNPLALRDFSTRVNESGTHRARLKSLRSKRDQSFSRFRRIKLAKLQVAAFQWPQCPEFAKNTFPVSLPERFFPPIRSAALAGFLGSKIRPDILLISAGLPSFFVLVFGFVCCCIAAPPFGVTMSRSEQTADPPPRNQKHRFRPTSSTIAPWSALCPSG